jgi:hypothetical protein
VSHLKLGSILGWIALKLAAFVDQCGFVAARLSLLSLPRVFVRLFYYFTFSVADLIVLW